MTNTLTAHLQVARYGDFLLTDAIRPALAVPIVPRAGYRQGLFRDTTRRVRMPMLAAAVSREDLMEAFLSLLEPLGDEVEVVMETSHDGTPEADDDGAAHRDLSRDAIDRPVLESHLYDFEDLLLDDGCTGIAVVARGKSMEIQFDEHKLLLVYARELRPFARVLEQFGLRRDDKLKLISEAEHMHSSAPHHLDSFARLCYRLGVGEVVEPVNW